MDSGGGLAHTTPEGVSLRVSHVLAGLGSTARTVGALRRLVAPAGPPECARSVLAARLADREAAFLDLLLRAVYRNPSSPYLTLLRKAGCAYGNVVELVGAEGLEGTLARLAAAGVYVTHDEMKGREGPSQGRGYGFTDAQFDNPLSDAHVRFTTSGSTGRATRVSVHTAHYREQAPQTAFSMEANGVADAAWALWLPPTEWCLSRLLRLTHLGRTPERWFSPLGECELRQDLRTWARWRGLFTLFRHWGLRPPHFAHAPLQKPTALVGWLARACRTGRPAVVVAYPSAAVRACLCAEAEGVPLDGCTFLAGGETVTEARRQCIESAGARCLPLFGATEMGEASEGCLAARTADDMHVYTHKLAVVTHRRTLADGSEVEPLLFTSLGHYSPKILINAETGDAGVLDSFDCGCPWHGLGFTTHLRGVWSFAKLTIEGITLPGGAILGVMEEDLPARFGGAAGDFQLLSEPGEGGTNVYRLLVSPRVASFDAEAIRAGFLAALGRRLSGRRTVVRFLAQAARISVVRREPVALAGGKTPSVTFRPEQP
jgi:hypothetical protein